MKWFNPYYWQLRLMVLRLQISCWWRLKTRGPYTEDEMREYNRLMELHQTRKRWNEAMRTKT